MSMSCPRATYRFQFNERFRLSDALALVPYLHGLGISHIYSSPLFKAAAHSAHGYDVCDFGRINPEIGTEEDLQNLVGTLRQHKMGLVLDIVPNHMGIATPENEWWQDVLKNGRTSPFADYFDIQWEPSDPQLRNKVLLPVLGDAYEKVLERGELKLEAQNGEPVLRYFDHRFPISPGSIPQNVSAAELNSDRSRLNRIVEEQNYRLTDWREGDEKLNYRRFFAINTLAGIRVEDETVFIAVHSLLKQWLAKDWFDGLRVDHPDGLRDPKQYADRLRDLSAGRWIVVEKILEHGEEVPKDWPVAGTVGYDFLNQVNGLFIKAENEKAILELYSEFTGEPVDTGKVVREKKRLVLETLFATEVNRLLALLVQIAARRPAHQKFSPGQLREALIAYAAAFPVYRTYVRPGDDFVGETDLRYARRAAAIAKGSGAGAVSEVLDFLTAVATLALRGEQESEFAARFQQLTGPVMAKGVEDTAFYCLNHFVSLNEVGGDPGRFGVTDAEFHKFCGRQQERGGGSMLCSSTHDTKRSEDVRARLNVLSEIPAEWRAAVLRWSKMNERYRRDGFPDRNAEYFLYQTLAGAWPISPERVRAYMEKASCEAKEHTNWTQRNVRYDEALKQFVTAALADADFVRDLEQFTGSIVEAGLINSLAQTLVKLTAPGAPDIYQGNEIFEFSLVDPDNRRPVDFGLRNRLLAEAGRVTAEAAWERRAEGLPKLWLIRKTLAFRARHEKLFAGAYEPVLAHGPGGGHIVAFIRGGGALTAIPRFTQSRSAESPALLLPRGMWRNEFTGEMLLGEVTAGKLFRKFPVALLVKE